MANILIIDDDEEIVSCHTLVLESRGHKVTAGYSGEEGWKILLETSPDIVILDCIMEEFTSGFSLAHDIKLKYPELPVIILTSIKEQMSSDWKYGENDRDWLPARRFLTKPVGSEKLLAEIEAVLIESGKVK